MGLLSPAHLRRKLHKEGILEAVFTCQVLSWLSSKINTKQSTISTECDMV